MLTVCCGALLVCCIALIVDLIAVKKQMKALQSGFDTLANFSLKHMQDKHSHE